MPKMLSIWLVLSQCHKLGARATTGKRYSVHCTHTYLHKSHSYCPSRSDSVNGGGNKN